MAPQAQRSGKRPAAEGSAPAATRSQQQTSTNLLDQLRRQNSEPGETRDIIPIPALIGVFVAVWVFVVFLMAPGWTDNFNSYLARARQNKGDHAGAIPPMSTLAAKYPDNTTYQSELGYNYYAISDYENALKQFTIAQQLEEARAPQSDDDGKPVHRADFNTMIGRTYLKMGDLENAEKHLQLALKRDRLDRYANLAMGELEFQRKDFRKAMSYFKVVAGDPEFRDSVQKYYDQIEQELFARVK